MLKQPDSADAHAWGGVYHAPPAPTARPYRRQLQPTKMGGLALFDFDASTGELLSSAPVKGEGDAKVKELFFLRYV